MDIVKKNLVSILCGVVALAAIVAWFWPIGGMYESLQADVSKSKETYNQVESLRTSPRKLPSLVLENSEQDPLTRFPNEKVITVGRQATESLKEQSQRMLKTVANLNIRKPLVPGSLPRAESRAMNDFPRVYLRHLGQTEEGWKTGLPLALRATQPPSREEIEEVARKIWDTQFKVRIFDVGGQDTSAQMGEEFIAATYNLPSQERHKRATDYLIYLDQESLPVSPDIRLGTPPKDHEIWFAQTALWITEDVVAAINAVNKGATNVLDAPVKHLVSLRVPFGPEQYRLPSAAPGVAVMASPDGGPPPVPVNANGVPEVFAVSSTGRVSNDIYDVIHFDLILRVDYRKIPQVLAELERNRLFTVLRTKVAAIDSGQELKTYGYVYGNDPVAEISSEGEALFLRSWTVDKEHEFKGALMPELVLQTIGAKPGPGVTGMGGSGYRVPGAVVDPGSMEQ